MSDYTPTRQELLTALVYYRARDRDTPPPPVSDLATREEVAQYLAESERGLTEVERAAAEKALTEAADDIDRRRSEPGLVHLDVKYAGYYAGIRSGMDSSSKALRTRSDSYRRNEGGHDD